MARMTKKTVARTALVEALAARGAQLAERDEITAVVRGCLQGSGMHFCEREVDGRIFFSGDFLTDESVVLIIPWAISVSEDLIVISCTIPLRVPKSKRDAIALYANEVNAEGHGIGTVLFDNETEGFRYQRDLLPSALKSNPDGHGDYDDVLYKIPGDHHGRQIPVFRRRGRRRGRSGPEVGCRCREPVAQVQE